MKTEYNGHILEVDRLIASLVLKIDGKVVDKVTGLTNILERNAELHGFVSNNDGSMTEITAIIENTVIAAIVKIYCDGQEVGQGILI